MSLVKPIELYQLLMDINQAAQEISKDIEMIYQHTKLSKKIALRADE